MVLLIPAKVKLVILSSVAPELETVGVQYAVGAGNVTLKAEAAPEAQTVAEEDETLIIGVEFTVNNTCVATPGQPLAFGVIIMLAEPAIGVNTGTSVTAV